MTKTTTTQTEKTGPLKYQEVTQIRSIKYDMDQIKAKVNSQDSKIEAQVAKLNIHDARLEEGKKTTNRLAKRQSEHEAYVDDNLKYVANVVERVTTTEHALAYDHRLTRIGQDRRKKARIGCAILPTISKAERLWRMKHEPNADQSGCYMCYKPLIEIPAIHL
jgi:hypothetical protein